MRIQLQLVRNDSLVKKFPSDPDFDFVIRCNDAVFKLQIAFLYLESKYFDEMSQKGFKQVELHQFDQLSLEGVLMVLYGGQLVIKSFANLPKVYEVVNFLQIESLREMILSQLQDQLMFLNPLQLLEFSYKNHVLTPQVSSLILQNDLELLRDPKLSMQLNKISPKVMNTVLLEYYAHSNENDKQTVKGCISGILSDYFHTKKIKPQQYFEELKSDILKEIWFQSHPVFFAEGLYDSQGIQEKLDAELNELTTTVKQLEERIRRNNQQIEELTQQVKQLKSREGQPNIIRFEDEQQTRVSTMSSPIKIEMGKLQVPPKIPDRISYEMNEDDSSQLSRRINQTSGVKLIQTVKDRNRNNSSSKG